MSTEPGSSSGAAYYDERAAKWAALSKAREAAKASESANSSDPAKTDPPQVTGKLVALPPRLPTDPLLWVEQNLGAELPVCVSNRARVTDETIEFVDDRGASLTLARTADSLLPAPEHYPIWLWFLDRCLAVAKADREDQAPRIQIVPAEVLNLLGWDTGGKQYKYVDEAFRRFSNLVVRAATAFHRHGSDHVIRENVGTLICYRSWREKIRSTGDESETAWAMPGDQLWSSIRAGYVLSVPLEQLLRLDSYVAQRLYTYLLKHCRPGAEFEISVAKLLPKIPLSITSDQVGNVLRPHHRALVAAGFLAGEPVFRRGVEGRIIVYKRA